MLGRQQSDCSYPPLMITYRQEMWNGPLFEQSVSLGLAGGFGDGAPAHVRVIASELRL